MLARQIIPPRPYPTNSCRLLPLFLRVVSFVFNSLQPLLPKTGGWGGLAQIISDFARRTHRFFTPLFSCPYKFLFQQLPCFHIYTKRGGVFRSVDGIRPAFPNQEFLGASPRFKPFNFQLSTVNRSSPQLECL